MIVIKLICRQWKLLISVLLFILIIVLCFIKPFYANWHSETIGAFNNCVLAIATSYVSGYIFYVFTVVIPKANRMKSIMDITKDNLRYARDTVCGFFLDRGGPYDFIKEGNDILIQYVAHNRDNNIYVIDDRICNMLITVIDQVQKYMQFVTSYSDYLQDDDVKTIKIIMDKTRSLESRMNDRHNNTELLNSLSYEEVYMREQDLQNLQTYHIDEIYDIIIDLKELVIEINTIDKRLNRVV